MFTNLRFLISDLRIESFNTLIINTYIFDVTTNFTLIS
jgi:hypothetical protein